MKKSGGNHSCTFPNHIFITVVIVLVVVSVCGTHSWSFHSPVWMHQSRGRCGGGGTRALRNFLFPPSSFRRDCGDCNTHSPKLRYFGSRRLGSAEQSTDTNTAAAAVMTSTTPIQTLLPRARRTRDIQQCGQTIASGGLVAFPTETVYGLGGYAFNASTLQEIFITKERPTTDPLIVHVLAPQNAYPLWHATTNTDNNNSNNNNNNLEQQILQTLCENFWPGPLTIVAKATTQALPSATKSTLALQQPQVLSLLTADTGFLAIRSPRHAVARALLVAATPDYAYIAAPSANKFGHVSPTTAQHVYDDLQYEPVLIYDDNDDDNHDETISHDEPQAPMPSACDVGVESTVVKVEGTTVPVVTGDDNNSTTTTLHQVTILRQGAISLTDITECLQMAGLLSNNIIVSSQIQRRTTDAEANVAPGQTIRHYSPNIPSYLVSSACVQQYQNHVANTNSSAYDDFLSTAVIIDYGQQLVACRPAVLEYYDLSPDCNSHHAAQILFRWLRTAETIPHATRILFPQYLRPTTTTNSAVGTTSNCNTDHSGDTYEEDALTLALQDRLTRAASGVVLDKFVGSTTG